MANPTWYDILGVPQDASAEQIKAAWRDATDKFEPGSGGQFRLFSEAADVLLDPAKRAAYDAELAGESPAAEPVVEPEPEPEPGPQDRAEPGAEPEGQPEAEPEHPVFDELAGGQPVPALIGTLGRALPAVLGVCVPLLLAGVLVLSGSAFGVDIGKLRIDSVSARSDARDWEAGSDASAAASRALTAVLSYDYRHMDADRDRAVRFLSDKGKKDYLKTFGLLTTGKDGQPGPVVKTKTVVTATVLGTGVSDASRNRVRVVVFVNQAAVKGSATTPSIFQNRVVVTMIRHGDAWLVDKINSY